MLCSVQCTVYTRIGTMKNGSAGRDGDRGPKGTNAGTGKRVCELAAIPLLPTRDAKAIGSGSV